MSDHDPEHLLKAQLKETTPEFERRWTNLKRELRTTQHDPSPNSPKHWAWWALPSLFSVGLLGFIVYVNLGTHQALPPDQVANFVQLLELEGDLRNALPLANAEVAETLLTMPLNMEDHS